MWELDELIINNICFIYWIGTDMLQISTLAFAVGGARRRNRMVYFYWLVLPVQANEPTFHLIQNRSGWPHEGPLNVLLTLGWSLNVKHLIVSGQLEGFLPGHHPFIDHVAFVTHQHQHHVFVTIVLDILHPTSHIPKGFLASEVEHHQSCSWWSVVGPGDGFEFFLACSVPNL